MESHCTYNPIVIWTQVFLAWLSSSRMCRWVFFCREYVVKTDRSCASGAMMNFVVSHPGRARPPGPEWGCL